MTSKDTFRVIRMQINNTLILGDDNFTRLEQDKLEKAKLSAKLVNILLYNTLLIFDNSILRIESNNIILV